MPVILSIKAKSNSIPVQNMRDGQLAEITENYDNSCVGKIVVRFGQTLYILGRTSAHRWIRPFTNKEMTMKVRILQAGEQLTIFNYDF